MYEQSGNNCIISFNLYRLLISHSQFAPFGMYLKQNLTATGRRGQYKLLLIKNQKAIIIISL